MKSCNVLLCAISVALVIAPNQCKPQERHEGVAAFSDWRSDAPGVARRISVGDLPAPLATSPTALRSQVSPRPADASIKTPAGFKAQVVADNLSGPRVIRSAPNGDIFLSESYGGRVRVLRFAPGQTGRRETRFSPQGSIVPMD